MSELSKALHAYTSNTRYAELPSITEVFKAEADWYSGPSNTDSVAYVIEAVFRIDTKAPAHTSKEHLFYIEKAAKERIVDAVFGEYRQPLLKLRELAVSRHDTASLEIISKIMDSMFKV